MISFLERSQPQQKQNRRPSKNISQVKSMSVQEKQDIFGFIKNEEKPLKSSSFFSQKSLSQDIIKVTDAQPDICLEAFYALYHTLWPQIEKHSSVSLKDAWKNFLGMPISKGILWSPEKLISKKKTKDIKKSLCESEGENQVFQDLDRVVSSIEHLKQKLLDYPDQLLQQEEIMISLDLLEEFFKDFKNQVKELVQVILAKEKMNVACVSEYDALVDLLEPKAVMMSDLFNRHWAYRISRSKAQKILSLDEAGHPLRSDSSEPSNHRVAALPEKSEESEPLVYFKANGNPPLQPEKEFMLYSLYKHLNMPVPETALLILTDVFAESSNHYYAVQASEAVTGESAFEAYRNQETIFEEKTYVLQVIGALLTDPLDGSFKNFKYSPLYQTLISIDNDLIFGPEFSRNGKTVNVKSVLYLLSFMDQPIPASIKTLFITLDPHLVIFAWLNDLDKKNNEYKLLFRRLSYQQARSKYQMLLPKNELPSLAEEIKQRVNVDEDLDANSFYPQIAVSKNLLNNITRKLKKIEATLLNKSSPSCQILFEEVCPVLGKYYRKLRDKFKDPKMALEALWGSVEDGNDYSCISSLLKKEQLSILAKSDENILDDEIKEIEPDKLFGEWRKMLQNLKQTPLDRLVRRHSERKMKGLLDLQQVLRELQLLKQENLTDSRCAREIIDFWHEISNIPQSKDITHEIRSLISNLPNSELKWLLTVERNFMRGDPENFLSSFQTVSGLFMKKRTLILTESEQQRIFDEQGNIRKNPSLTLSREQIFFPGMMRKLFWCSEKSTKKPNTKYFFKSAPKRAFKGERVNRKITCDLLP